MERSRPVKVRAILPAALLVLVLATAALAGEAPAPAEPSGPAAVVTIGDKAFPCRVVKHDEKGVTVFLTEAKSTVTLQWNQLADSERERIRSLVAAKDQPADSRTLGDEIDGVEVTLNSGGTYRGVELTDRQTETHRFFRCRGTPLIGFAVKDIKAVKPIKLREGEIYSAQDRYKRKLAVSPPQSAEDHFQLGVWCLENGLAQDAKDHFEKAVLLDPAYAEKVKARKADLDALVLKGIPPKVERPADPAALRRAVISGWHLHLDYHIQRVATTFVSETPAMPVKVVRLTDGRTLEGALKSSEDAAEILLDIGGRTYAVERKLIVGMEQKMVETGPFRHRTLAECKKYVTDAKGGIGRDVAAGVAKDLGVADKEVLDIWAARLDDKVVVGPGGPKDLAEVASLHEARWGVGSWLRGGGAANPVANPVVNPRGNRGGQQNQQQQLKDPETWWKEQAAATKAGILKAMCAEESGLFKVEKVFEENCTQCGGTGKIEVMGAGTGGGGKIDYACSVCRGSGKFCGVSYR
jgi:tetratricopeptide (TPR) repeat protein